MLQEQEAQKAAKARCYSCGSSRPTEELGECLCCGARVCGSRETKCKATCFCDAAEFERLLGTFAGEDATMSEQPGRFARELNRLMKTHEPRLSVTDLADKLGFSYEFTRKLVKGENHPTQQTLIIMSDLFGVVVSQLEVWVTESKLAKLYGQEIAWFMSDPTMKAVNTGLPRLGGADRDEILVFLQKKLAAARSLAERKHEEKDTTRPFDFLTVLKQQTTLLTAEQVADFLNVSPETIMQMAAKQDIPSILIGGHRRFDPKMLYSWYMRKLGEGQK